MSGTKFFVYGTLKVGGRFAGIFDSRRLSVKKATVNGTMYSVSKCYPAVKFNNNGIIHGEIHEYVDEKEVQEHFNRIEGFYGENVDYNLYNRVKIKVTNEDGNEVDCYAYEFNKDTATLEKVENGIWEI